jgi:hypothetical protein
MQIGTFKGAVVSGGLWMAWLLLLPALLIPAPAACFFLSFLAVTCAIFPLALGSKKQKIGALIAMLIGIALAASTAGQLRNDPYYKKHRNPSVQNPGTAPKTR